MPINTSVVVGGLSCAMIAVAAAVFVAVDPLASSPAGSADTVVLMGNDDRYDRDDFGNQARVTSDDDDDDDDEDSIAAVPGGGSFELEIDPELDAQFGPRPVNAVQAAQIATDRFGGVVTEAELDEEDGRPIWEIELRGASVSEVDVDAIDGSIRISD